MTFSKRDKTLDLNLEISIQGEEKKLLTSLPFVKSKNKHLFLAMDSNGAINVFGKKPLYVGNINDEDSGWDNSTRMDEEGDIKIFDYALVGYYTGKANIKFNKCYKFKNPFLVKACDLLDYPLGSIIQIEFKLCE